MKHRAKGFTLIEVMIAVAVLAIALVAVFQLQSQSISMSTESRFTTTAALLAQSKMVEIESAANLGNRSDDGDFGPDYSQYSWHLEIGDTQLAQFKKIEITVTNKLFAKGGKYKLVLYRTAES
jgi:general secretion pathway protein I